jgi:signal transduction histidine kinase
MLGLLAGTLAHDIQNPLAVILGNAEILQAKFPNEERVVQGSDAIIRQTERVSELVDSIQNYSRGDAEVFEAVDVHRVLREALMLTERLLSQVGVVVVQNYDTELPLAFGNANRLEQVFMNLIQNAAQAMQKKDQRELQIITQKLDRADIPWVEISIRDTGGGVPQEREKDIFKAFFTTKAEEKGTGLGLAICHRIMRAHGGELELQNSPGVGATFVARIATQDLRTDE